MKYRNQHLMISSRWLMLTDDRISAIITALIIQIARDGRISDDEIKDFALISKKLDEISLAIDSLNLWIDKTASEQALNIELLNEEKEKLK